MWLRADPPVQRGTMLKIPRLRSRDHFSRGGGVAGVIFASFVPRGTCLVVENSKKLRPGFLCLPACLSESDHSAVSTTTNQKIPSGDWRGGAKDFENAALPQPPRNQSDPSASFKKPDLFMPGIGGN